jgi:hypothetical protein
MYSVGRTQTFGMLKHHFNFWFHSIQEKYKIVIYLEQNFRRKFSVRYSPETNKKVKCTKHEEFLLGSLVTKYKPVSNYYKSF